MSCNPCNPCKPQVKILKTGSSLEAQKVVRAVTVAGSSLRVTNTDGSTYDLELPKAEPANINEVNILNASGTRTVATVATLK